MKKIFCVIVLLSCFLGSCLAQQTIEYVCTHYYQNDAKMKREKPIFMYITFMDDYARFYESDANGICRSKRADGSPRMYRFERTQSDYFLYTLDIKTTMTAFGREITNRLAVWELMNSSIYKFSKDLSILNVGGSSYTEVFKRVSKAEKEAILREHEESLPKLLQ